MKFSIKDFFSKCDQNRIFLRIWSHFLKKSSMENFIFVQWNFYLFIFIFLDFQSTYFYKKHPFANSYRTIKVFIEDNFENI